ncbi:MAG: hypothetical protein DRP49_04310 [Spirochaetes bacterium]|nr:MAG: hypothetical protein DRP49_04310 [Spirochaetota bacterium]
MRQQDAAERRNQRPGVRRHDADERRASPAGSSSTGRAQTRKRIPPPIAGEQWLYRSTDGVRDNSAGTPVVIQVQIAGHEMK